MPDLPLFALRLSRRSLATPLFLLGLLASATAAFGKDPNQPVGRHAIEAGVGYGYAMVPGTYDSTGAYHEFPAGFLPVLHGMPLSLKFGLGGGVDLKADWSAVFSNDDAGDLQGMSQPRIGLRFLGWTWGGAYGNVTLPFATGNLDDGDLSTIVEVGGLLRRRWARARLTTLASVADDFEDLHSLRLMAKGDWLWKRATGSGTVDFARARDRDAWLLLAGPTLRYDLSKVQAFDAAASFTVAGRNAPAGWTARMSAYRTFTP